MAVFVLDKQKRPLMPCSEKRARLMLERGRAVVHKRYPFTIRLKDRVGGDTQPLKLTLDPGSKESGLAITREDGEDRHVLCLYTLVHRGVQIRAALDQRRAFRRRRRSQNLRHRAPRVDNRTRRDGWLPPSLQHRVDTLSAWVDRLCRLAPITSWMLRASGISTHCATGIVRHWSSRPWAGDVTSVRDSTVMVSHGAI